MSTNNEPGTLKCIERVVSNQYIGANDGMRLTTVVFWLELKCDGIAHRGIEIVGIELQFAIITDHHFVVSGIRQR